MNQSGSGFDPLSISNDEPRAGPSGGRTNTIDETDSIMSIHGRDNYAPSVAPSHMSETESVMISGSMPPRQILAQLCRHGCKDITNRLNLNTVSQSFVLNGGFGDVYRGALCDGRRVAIKCPRILVGRNEEGEKQIKARQYRCHEILYNSYTRPQYAARELYIWSKFKHPNIQELFGVALYKGQVAMVSPWMTNGNLSWYISQHPDVDRYNLCVQAAAAVAYLRECGVVHGDIKGANYLVTDDNKLKLTDFGGSMSNQCSLKFTSPDSSPQTTLRWTAPEIFLDETKTTYEGDVYALGMTILEIITGSVPWKGILDSAVMHKLIQRLHPSRPEERMPIGDPLSDALWESMVKCWESKSERRPLPTKVRDELKVIYKQHRLALYGAEGIDTDKSSSDTDTPPSLDADQSSVLSSRKSLLDRVLRRPSNSSLNSPESNHRRAGSIASLTSLSNRSQTYSLPSPEEDTSSVTSISSHWSGNTLGFLRGRGHQRSSSKPSAYYKSPSLASDTYEGESRLFLSSSVAEPVINDYLNGSVDTTQLLDRGYGPTHAPPSRTRNALLIGAAPRNHAFIKRVSIIPPSQMFEEFGRMESAFRDRGYSVQTLRGEFDAKRALSTVAQFLDDSQRGDIRAIVFYGYGGWLAHPSLKGLFVPIWTLGSFGPTISFRAWERNIRNHSRPGVVVFSIMIHGSSNQIMKQEFDRHVWEVPKLMKVTNKDEPIYLTFASTHDLNFRGGLTSSPEQISIGHHFIHALIGAIQSVDTATSTWEEFFEEFDRQFLGARSSASLLEKERTGNLNLNWRLKHPQTPRFSASAFVALSDIF